MADLGARPSCSGRTCCGCLQVDEHTVTIAAYAVRVQFVPKDVTKDELKAYFEEWGTVSLSPGC